MFYGNFACQSANFTARACRAALLAYTFVALIHASGATAGEGRADFQDRAARAFFPEVFDFAKQQSPQAPPVPAGGVSNCCTEHTGPGCDSSSCQAKVCDVNSFCCDFEWDETCANMAADLCVECGGASSCCQIHHEPGCDVPSCEALVCAEFPACCTQAWGDVIVFKSGECVDLAIALCGDLCDEEVSQNCGEVTSESCCLEHGSPGCNDDACCEAICFGTDPGDPNDMPDSYCCLVEWDQLCANQAINNPLCSGDGCSVGPGNCCENNDFAKGCDEQVCEDCVCSINPFCCNFGWVPFCPAIAKNQCSDVCTCAGGGEPVECPPSSNDCCFAGFDNPGCEDTECCDAVCELDPFCCTGAWDFSCVDQAERLCAVCGGGGECPGTLNSSLPSSGTVDARQPFEPAGGPLQGIGSASESIRVNLGATGADASCFTVCESSNGGLTPNAISSVTDGGNGSYTIKLARAITPNAATTISYAGGGSVTYFAHPANVNADSLASPADVLSIVDILNGVGTAPFGKYSSDVDHSGQTGAPDILRVVDLLNGANAYDVQNGTPKPAAPPCE